MRLFILIGLIINVKINLNCSLKSFFNLKKKFIQKYSNFKLKVDFIVYMFLGMYVEHFRIFKYNEYIMSNVSLVIGYGASRMLMRRYPSWQRWLDRVYIKSILISGIYNIYKVRGFLNN